MSVTRPALLCAHVAPILTLAASLLQGCASVQPQARVVGAAITRTTDAGAQVLFTVEAKAPDSRKEIRLARVRCDFTVEGKPVYTGVRSAEATIAPTGVATIEIPVAFAWSDVGLTAAPRTQRSLAYTLSARVQYVPPDVLGRALFTTGLRTPTIAVVDAGSLVVGNAANDADTEGSSQNAAGAAR